MSSQRSDDRMRDDSHGSGPEMEVWDSMFAADEDRRLIFGKPRAPRPRTSEEIQEHYRMEEARSEFKFVMGKYNDKAWHPANSGSTKNAVQTSAPGTATRAHTSAQNVESPMAAPRQQHPLSQSHSATQQQGTPHGHHQRQYPQIFGARTGRTAQDFYLQEAAEEKVLMDRLSSAGKKKQQRFGASSSSSSSSGMNIRRDERMYGAVRRARAAKLPKQMHGKRPLQQKQPQAQRKTVQYDAHDAHDVHKKLGRGIPGPTRTPLRALGNRQN